MSIKTKDKSIEFKINEEIKSKNFFLIADSTLPSERQIQYPLNTVLIWEDIEQLKNKLHLDVIEINRQDEKDLSICIIADYNKYLYRLNKEKNTKRNQNKTTIKIIRLNLMISENDLERKCNDIKKFLTSGNPVKIEIRKGKLHRMRFATHYQEFWSKTLQPVLDNAGMKYNTTYNPNSIIQIVMVNSM